MIRNLPVWPISSLTSLIFHEPSTHGHSLEQRGQNFLICQLNKLNIMKDEIFYSNYIILCNIYINYLTSINITIDNSTATNVELFQTSILDLN